MERNVIGEFIKRNGVIRLESVRERYQSEFDFLPGTREYLYANVCGQDVEIDKAEATFEEYAAARRNTECEASIMGLTYKLFAEMGMIPYEEDPLESTEEIYVVTNRNGNYGAGCVLTEKFRKFAEAKANQFDVEEVFIMPSSVHEVLAVFRPMTEMEAKKMVREVNRSEVETEEWVADTAWIYNINTEKFREVK